MKPGRKKNEILIGEGGAIRVMLQAPPVDGRANEALVRFLGEFFDLPQSRISILRGHSARIKIIEINADEKLIQRRLNRMN